jgi:hypothetical protein
MSVLYRRHIPVAITFILGIFLIFSYYLQLPQPIKAIGDALISWGVVILAFSLTLGTVNVAVRHTMLVTKRVKENNQWMYSLITLFFMVAFLVLGFGFGIDSETHGYYYSTFYSPAAVSAYSMWAFWMMSAAYRAFRARNVEAGLILLTAFFVFFGNAPIGETIWGGFPTIKEWLMTVPNSAANRGIMIGSALGAIALAYRTITGKEKGYMGGEG